MKPMKPNKLAKMAVGQLRHGFESAADVVVALSPLEPPLRLTRSLAATALEAVAFGAETAVRALPAGLQETVAEAFPNINIDELYARVVERIGGYARPEDPTYDPYEKIKAARQRFELSDGKRVVLRAPREKDRHSLEQLYLTLSPDDRYTRFFGGMSAEAARDNGMKCSSLVDAQQATDFVIVDRAGGVGGHAGYVVYDDGVASMHIVVHPDYRKATQQGDRIPQIMFEQVIATAMLDPRVNKLVAETLRQNNGINNLVAATMGTHEGFFRTDEGGYLDNELRVTH